MSSKIRLFCRGNYILLAEDANITISHNRDSETIPISHIQSFSLKEPGIMGIGTITIKTGQSATAGVNVGFGLFLAGGSEKTLNFNASELQIALQIQDYIAHYQDQKSSSATELGAGKVVSVAEEIRNLKGLLDDGILTQEEFDAKKKQLLAL